MSDVFDAMAGSASPTTAPVNSSEAPDVFGAMLGTHPALPKAIGDISASPDEAGKAVSLQQKTGIPASVIQPDLPAVEQRQKSSEASALIQANPHISTYVSDVPMASKVSNDDYGQLDKVSKAAGPLAAPGLEDLRKLSAQGIVSSLKAGNIFDVPSQIVAYGALSAASVIKSFMDDPSPENALNAAMIVEGGKLPLPWTKDIRTAAPADIQLGPVPRAPGLSTPEEVQNFLKTVRGIDTRLEINEFLKKKDQSKIPLLEGPKEVPAEDMHPVAASKIIEGQNVEPRLDPLTDEVHINQRNSDEAHFDNTFNEVQLSRTKERSPYMIEQFLDGIVKGKSVYLSPDAIDNLYQGKAPAEGDGLFGYVPNIERKLADARETGADVQIGMANYLANTDKAVHGQVKDELRFRPEGVTKTEATELAAKPEEQEKIKSAAVQIEGQIFEGATHEGALRKAAEELKLPFDTVADTYMQKALASDRARNELEAAGGDKEKALYELGDFLNRIVPGKIQDEVIEAIKILKSGKESNIDGFTTSTGRYVSRGEAKQIADKADQIKRDKGTTQLDSAELYSEHVNAEKKILYLDPLFKDAASAGMTESQFKAYSNKIEKSDSIINEKAQKFAEREAKRHLTPEFKENEAAIKLGVETDLAKEKVITADRYFREGVLPGGREVDKRLLDREAVKTILGKDISRYTTDKNGVLPDDFASLFSYDSGAALVRDLDSFNTARGELGPKAYFDKLVKEETARRMEAEYGTLQSRILEEARENAISTHIEDILSDEMVALAKQAGGKVPLSRDGLESMAAEAFERTELKEAANYENYRRAADKAGRAAEKALLKGDFKEAFKQKQRQFLAVLTAKESRKFSKLYNKTENQIDNLLKKENKSIDSDFLSVIRKSLQDIGYQNRSPLKPDAPTLNQLVGNSNGQVAVASWMLDPQLKNFSSLEDMNAGDYSDLAKSIQSLVHVGRDIKKVDSIHGKAEKDNVIFDIVKELERFRSYNQPANPSIIQKARSFGRLLNGAHILVERIFDYTEQFDPNGPITTYVDRPLRDAYSKRLRMEEAVAKKLRSLKEFTDSSINDLIDNKTIPDVMDTSGYLNMTRHNLRQLMLQMGSESGVKKVVEGFFGKEAAESVGPSSGQFAIEKLINDNATKADWQWVQGLWDIFKELKPEADAVQARVTGVPADSIKTRSITNKHGEWTGGYAPIGYDKYNSDISSIINDKNLFQQNYVTASTPHSYTIARTGYVGAVDLSGVMLPNKIQAMIHDIAFREAVLNANKIINDPTFMQEFAKKWSKEYADLLPGWLRYIANAASYDEAYAMDGVRLAAALRQNVVSTLIAFNPGTFIKHGMTAAVMSVERVGLKALSLAGKEIGPKAAFQTVKDLVKPNAIGEVPADFISSIRDSVRLDEVGDDMREFILANSSIMRARQRQYIDTVRGAFEDSSKAGVVQTAKNVRQLSMAIGRTPVAFSDALTAMPTWLAAYKDAMSKAAPAGDFAGAHKDAVFAADREVARAHGSSFPGDKPRVMQLPNSGPGEFMRWMTGLYGFWNHMQNNLMQLGWDVTAKIRGPQEGFDQEPRANLKSIAARFAMIAVIIAIEEEASAPLDEHRYGLGEKALRASIRFFGGGYIGIRELTTALAGGYDPTVGLIGTLFKEGQQTTKDISNFFAGKPGKKDAFIHTMTALGALTGIGGTQVGKTGSFIADYMRGRERINDSPSDIIPGSPSLRQGLRTGHTQPRVFK